MLTRIANGDSRLSRWLRVREFAVPPAMIETATAQPARRGLGGCVHRRRRRPRLRPARPDAPSRPRARLPSTVGSAPVGTGSAALAPAEDRPGRAAPPGADHRAGPVPDRRASPGAPGGPDPARLGGQASGSASGSGTAPGPPRPPGARRTPARTRGSASTCTVTSGTRAGPVSCAAAPEPTVVHRRLPSSRPWCRPATRAPSTAGRPRRPSCSGPRAGPPAPSVSGSGPGTGCFWSWTEHRARPCGPPSRPGSAGHPRRPSCPTRRPGRCPTSTCSGPD